MANTHGPLAPVNFMPKVQDFLNNFLVAKGIANTKFAAQLKSGQSIDFPTITDMRVQTYTPGTDLTIDNNTATSDTMLINQSRASTFTLDPNAMAQAEDKTVNALMARQAAFVLAQDMDQKILKEGVDNANNTVAGGTISSSTIYAKMTDATASLQRSNGADGPLFAVLDPERIALLAQSEVANGFNVADSALKNGFVGDSQAGFKVFNSNNLPTSVTITIDTIPTATDTFTIGGVVFTCVADGTAAAAGEVNVGANVADFKTIFVDVINGANAGTDYVDVSVANRRKLQNAGFSAATFVADDCVITAFGKQGNSETFTPANNAFGTETGSLLFGRMGAVSLGMQIQPSMASAPLPNRPMETNFAIHQLFGKKVFTRDKDRIVDMTLNI